MAEGTLIIFSAASGAGKTTLLNHLRASVPELVYCISTTSRPPRGAERDGVHYHFVKREEFERRAALSEFAEWQEVHGNLYGTPRREIDEALAKGRCVVKEADVHGRVKLDLVYRKAIGVLIVPPSGEELERRLRGRGTDCDEVIRRRLANAVDEMRVARECGKYQHTVVNDSLERAGAELVALVRGIMGHA